MPPARYQPWIAWPLRTFVLFLLIFSLVLLFGPWRYDLRSYVLLTHFLDPRASGPLLRWETNQIAVEDVRISSSSVPVQAHLYLPVGISHPPGIVIVHGIHHLGFDEPRLVSLARAAAGSGFAVLTPQVAALADYHVDAASVETIGLSSAWLQQRLGDGPVTVIGVSFGGGLSLLAACDPRYAPHMRALVLIGAYDSLARVSRFLISDEAELPDGRKIPYTAHEYGVLVYIYSHLEEFFPPSELSLSREALRDLLWEQPQAGQPLLARLSPAARSTMDSLFAHQVARLRPQLLASIIANQAELAALSPEGHLANLRVPVYILHGSTDDIIPYTESLWLAREVPRQELREVLITGAFSHVNPSKTAGDYQELRLIHFLGNVLGASAPRIF